VYNPSIIPNVCSAIYALEPLEVVRVDVRVDEGVHVRSDFVKHCGHAARDRSEQQEQAGGVNDGKSHRSFGGCMADANRDEAARAAEMGRKFMGQREYERAIRLLERSNALYPSSETAQACMNRCWLHGTSNV
jgi:hypothetical protein